MTDLPNLATGGRKPITAAEGGSRPWSRGGGERPPGRQQSSPGSSPRPGGTAPEPSDQEPQPRSVPWAAIAVAGVLAVASWGTVNYALNASSASRDEAYQLAIVATEAQAIVDTRNLVDVTRSQAGFELGVRQSLARHARMSAALAELPEADADLDDVRARTGSLLPLARQVIAARDRGDLAEARSLGRGQLRTDLAALVRESRELSAERMARANTIETVARATAAIALIGGSVGIALFAMTFSRLRQRALVEQTRAEIEERTSSRLDALVSHATDAVTVLDEDGRITWISSAPSFPLVRSPQQIVGHFFTDLVHPTDRRRAAQAFTELLATDGVVTTTHLRLSTAQGDQRPVELRGENRLGDPAINGVILTVQDVSERTLLEDQLERLASRDPVTGVANRAQLEAHLQSAVLRRARRGGFAGLLLVDLDDFRAVSDTLGHDAGDELLRHAANRLEATAGDADLVARLDGDTFAVLLDDLQSVGDAQRRAERMLIGLRGRASVSGGHAVDIDAHGGLALGAAELPPRDIIRHADIALLEAKEAGAKEVVSFTDAMRNKVSERVELTGDLRQATERDEFDVEYQPIVEMATGRTVGVEALVRWSHPERGRLSPATFVDLAEQTGLIRPLGELVLRQACREIAALLRRTPTALDYVSVNVSPRQLEDPDLTDVVISALDDAGLPADKLLLELTERSIATDPERLVQRLVELRALGIRIALDDFGAGYSFLSFLEDYPLDALKIDRSLVKSMAERTDAALLLQGIVQISDVANMKVIVEGIETEAQATRAQELGIKLGQGYLFARPAPLGALGLED